MKELKMPNVAFKDQVDINFVVLNIVDKTVSAFDFSSLSWFQQMSWEKCLEQWPSVEIWQIWPEL